MMRRIRGGRFASAAFIVVVIVLASAAPARAALDNELSLVDGLGRTLTVQQWDTTLNAVPPLDRNRLTREWFFTGQAKFAVTGTAADDFSGTLQLGYQIAFPWSLGVGIGFRYTTPNTLIDKGNPARPPAGLLRIITPNLLPGVSFKADLGNGPGVQEVVTFAVAVTGRSGAVAVSNAHGTVSGAAGAVLLRPFARLVAQEGDSVTTYSDPWNLG